MLLYRLPMLRVDEKTTRIFDLTHNTFSSNNITQKSQTQVDGVNMKNRCATKHDRPRECARLSKVIDNESVVTETTDENVVISSSHSCVNHCGGNEDKRIFGCLAMEKAIDDIGNYFIPLDEDSSDFDNTSSDEDSGTSRPGTANSPKNIERSATQASDSSTAGTEKTVSSYSDSKEVKPYQTRADIESKIKGVVSLRKKIYEGQGAKDTCKNQQEDGSKVNSIKSSRTRQRKGSHASKLPCSSQSSRQAKVSSEGSGIAETVVDLDRVRANRLKRNKEIEAVKPIVAPKPDVGKHPSLIAPVLRIPLTTTVGGELAQLDASSLPISMNSAVDGDYCKPEKDETLEASPNAIENFPAQVNTVNDRGIVTSFFDIFSCRSKTLLPPTTFPDGIPAGNISNHEAIDIPEENTAIPSVQPSTHSDQISQLRRQWSSPRLDLKVAQNEGLEDFVVGNGSKKFNIRGRRGVMSQVEAEDAATAKKAAVALLVKGRNARCAIKP